MRLTSPLFSPMELFHIVVKKVCQLSSPSKEIGGLLKAVGQAELGEDHGTWDRRLSLAPNQVECRGAFLGVLSLLLLNFSFLLIYIASPNPQLIYC
jgi:hypothetical protein